VTTSDVVISASDISTAAVVTVEQRGLGATAE